MQDPFEAAEGLNIALNDHDMDAVADSFTEDAVVTIEPSPPPPDRETYRGKQEIMDWLSGLVDANFRMEWRNFETFEGNRVRWIADIHAGRYRQFGLDPVEVINEAVVEGDRIKSLTITFVPGEMEQIQARSAAMQG